MNELEILCKKHKLEKSVILLYSGYYDSDNSGTNQAIIPSNFVYLTKLDIPNLIVIYYNKTFTFIYDYSVNNWGDDAILKPIYNVYSKNTIIHLPNKLSEFLSKPDINVYTLSNYNSIPQMYSIFHIKFKNTSLLNSILLDSSCNKMRIIKNKSEKKNILIATRYTIKAFRELLTNFKKKKYNYSYQIVNFMKCYWGQFNINELAYKPICTVGNANTILHSNIYNYKLIPGKLILLDIACKYNNYCSDITRTFPVNGKFTNSQKIIYNIVLDINTFAIKSIFPGLSWDELEQKCYLRLYNSLLKIDLIKSIKRSVNEKIAVARIFMKHSLGHNIGIDVHDPPFKILTSNMLLTIEPGIYFDAHQYNNSNINSNIWKKYSSIGGIRIEDVVLIDPVRVSKQNPSLSAISISPLAKTISGIEKLMN